MSLRRFQTRKYSRRLLKIRQNSKRERRVFQSNYQLSDHFYETRSKSLQIIDERTTSSQSVALTKQSSDSSVIYLGSFRKIPELINLEDSDDHCEEQLIKLSEEQSSEFEELHNKKLKVQ
ncbi:uncharacterized protein LOC113464198 [Ceratina calcarata]|uniref:Uncharacterized protein LOC113464198 n=1 Tax=Ceratina calcarata TaxID=156304 RepID=A0AAJ7RZD8_9HYME|nr:uncharacterized protein LOC113464198 [Ceratina calcarata]